MTSHGLNRVVFFRNMGGAWRTSCIVLLFMTGTGVRPVFAGGRQSGDEQETIRRMNEQIQELQARVKALEEKLSAAHSSALPAQANETAAKILAEGAPPPEEKAAEPVSAAAAESGTSAQETSGSQSVPSVKLRMFGDVGYRVSDQKGQTNSFHVGTLDLLMTGALSDRVSVLAEVLFIPLEDDTFEADVERLLLQYKHNDYLNFAIGRYHANIGYYNTAFHQGSWFETAIGRPYMYAFDDQEGFLPLQEVGFNVSGQVPSGDLGLNYVAEVGNGRLHLQGAEPAQNFQDANNGKSVNLALFAKPGRLPGFQTGFSVYHDYLTFPNQDNVDEVISTVHAVYSNSNYEFLNEAMLVRHATDVTGAPRRVFHTSGFYTQLSRRFGRFRPYFRYSYVNSPAGEPVYDDPADAVIVGRRNGPTFGLRFDMNHYSAVKIQYDRLAQRGQPTFNMLQTQFSFAF